MCLSYLQDKNNMWHFFLKKYDIKCLDVGKNLGKVLFCIYTLAYYELFGQIIKRVMYLRASHEYVVQFSRNMKFKLIYTIHMF